MGVTERTKNGEKGVKDMTREHFLEVNDTAGPPQPGVETETGSRHRPGTRRNENENTSGGKHKAGERTGPGRRGILSSAPRGRGNAPGVRKDLQRGTLQPPNSESGIFRHTVLKTTSHVSCPGNLQGDVLHQRQRKQGTPPTYTHTHRRERRPRAG